MDSKKNAMKNLQLKVNQMSRSKVYVHNARQCGKRSQNIDRLIELIEEGKIIMNAPSKDDCLDEI